MKELSIEEKAKAYDEAIERAKNFIENGDERERTIAESIFAGIMEESEDERIRKALIRFHKSTIDVDGIKGEDIIAWLENHGEQKLTDKVEPKFKAGDWVVCNNGSHPIFQVIERSWPNAKYRDIKGTEIFLNVKTLDKQYHLWTIQKDAKAGDVLVSESTCGLGTWYCIFKSLDSDESMTVYCYLARDGRFETKKELCFDKDPYNTKPATKEQRNLLFQKMHEAGYEWDAEKKELKKVENKNPLLSDFFKDEYERGKADAQKSAWSEEDENIRQWIISDIDKLLALKKKSHIIADKEINWLKSLKERYSWKPSDEQMEALLYEVNAWDKDSVNGQNLKSLYQELKKLKEK